MEEGYVVDSPPRQEESGYLSDSIEGKGASDETPLAVNPSEINSGAIEATKEPNPITENTPESEDSSSKTTVSRRRSSSVPEATHVPSSAENAALPTEVQKPEKTRTESKQAASPITSAPVLSSLSKPSSKPLNLNFPRAQSVYVQKTIPSQVNINRLSLPTGVGSGASRRVIPPVLDAATLDALEAEAKSCAGNLSSVISSLRSAMHARTNVTRQSMEVFKESVENVSTEVTSNVGAMHVFIRKAQQLNEDMKYIDSIANDIKEIKKTLDLLELFYVRMHNPRN